MTLHPWHLHAYTALTSLAKSWPAARAAAGRITLQSYDGLRTTIYGRTSTGGISDGGMLTAVQRGGEEAAHEREMTVVALTGARGGRLAAQLRDTDVHVCVPHDQAARVTGRPYTSDSSSARHEASMMFPETPIVVHSCSPFEAVSNTRVTAPVASPPSRMRTL